MWKLFISLSLILIQTISSSQLCNYSLDYSVCVHHLANQNATNCDNQKLLLSVEESDVSLRVVIEEGFADLGLTVQLEKDEDGTWNVSSDRDLTEYSKDMLRGIVRLFRPELLPIPKLGDCVMKIENLDENNAVKRESCIKTSMFENIYHIEKLETELKERRIEGNIEEIKANQNFIRHSNFNLKIGESVETKIHLKRKSCDGKSAPSQKLETIGGLESLEPTEDNDETNDSKYDSKILSEKDPLKLIKKLRPVLKSLSEEEVGKYLKKHRRYTKFPYILEACGSLGLWKIHKQVFVHLLELEENTPLLEKYLISLSFAANFEDEIVEHLESIVKNAKHLKNLQETSLYCLCNQQRKQNDKERKDKLLELAGGLKCKEESCRRKVVFCLSAIQSGGYLKDLLSILRNEKEDRLSRELVASALQSQQYKENLEQKEILRLLNPEGNIKNELYNKILDLVDFQLLSISEINKLIKESGNNERISFLVQKIMAHSKRFQTDYSIQSYSSKGQSVYMYSPMSMDESGKVLGSFSFSSTMNSAALSRTSFSLKLRDLAGQEKDLMSIRSFIGGMSGMVGTADPDDDPDANAKIHISILGMPMRPLVLFSSMADLIDLYWSGAGQEKTTLLQGSLTLEDKESVVETLLGTRIKTKSNLALHLHSQGEGGISIWTSTGSGNLNTAITVAGESGISILTPGSPLEVSSSIRVQTGVSAEAVVSAGSGVSACTVMSLDDLTVSLQVATSQAGGQTVQDLRFPGVTFNLGRKINEICNQLLE